MSRQRQLGIWAACLFVSALFLWVFNDVLLPFVAGMALAYFLDPIADRMERAGLSRAWATSVILVGFIVVAVSLILIVAPMIWRQAAALAEQLPAYFDKLRLTLVALAQGPLGDLLDLKPQEGGGTGTALAKDALGWIGTVLGNVLSGGLAVVNLVSLLLITPIVAFYMLLDWDRMVARIDSWLPRDHAETIRGITRDIDQVMAGFVRGQVSVCLALAIFYGVALTVAGLNYGAIVGLIAGGLSFIPYVGATVGLVLSIGLAIAQFWPDWVPISIIAVIFFVGQAIEGNFLSPRFVGDRVGLHPVWVMFALLAFGSVFGFVGLLVAVPVTAAIGVVIRFTLQGYLRSRLYLGTGQAAVSRDPESGGDG